MGIAAHLGHAVKEKGLKGSFDLEADPKLELPNHMEYVFFWIGK